MSAGPVGRPLRLGTRGSALALAQTELVIRALRGRFPEIVVEPVVVRTQGDLDKTSPLTVIGGRGVFTSALQEALARGEIDAAVHSAKDLPSDQPPGLALVAFPVRDDPRDVLVTRHDRPLAQLPSSPTIGTSSRRRAVQVRALRPDCRIVELRGNIDTRLRRALDPALDGIVLAAAGVRRMGWADRIREALPLDRAVPSPGQGALALEARHDDRPIVDLLAAIDAPEVAEAVRIERAFLRAVGGGCTMPVGAHAEPIAGGAYRLRAMLADEEGERIEWADERFAADEAERGAAGLALRMLTLLRIAGATTFGYHPSPSIPARVGNGVRVHSDDRPPLAGLTVLVTRARHQAAALSKALRAEGAEAVELPTIRIAPPSDPTSLDEAVRHAAAGRYDWIVFTSGNGVDQVLARASALGVARDAFADARVAAVGTVTAERLGDAGVRVDLVPARAEAESVVAALVARGVAGQRVLYPRADIARDAITAGLRAAGALVDEVEAYRTVPETVVDPGVRERIARGDVDIATFASGSSVRNLVALLGDDVAALQGAEIACVGPVTAAAARELGFAVDVVADDASIGGLVAALVEHRRHAGAAAPGAGRVKAPERSGVS